MTEFEWWLAVSGIVALAVAFAMGLAGRDPNMFVALGWACASLGHLVLSLDFRNRLP